MNKSTNEWIRRVGDTSIDSLDIDTFQEKETFRKKGICKKYMNSVNIVIKARKKIKKILCEIINDWVGLLRNLEV